MKKSVAVIASIIFVATTLSSQSLVELARQEKERRESLKQKSSVIITNRDLTLIKKKPAIEAITSAADLTESGEQYGYESQASTSGGEIIMPRILPPGPLLTGATSATDQSSGAQTLKARLNQANEMVDLLTTKMNGLWQEFYSLDDMTTRDRIQQQIAETFEKLQKAQEEQSALKAQLEKTESSSVVKK